MYAHPGVKEEGDTFACGGARSQRRRKVATAPNNFSNSPQFWLSVEETVLGIDLVRPPDAEFIHA